MNRRIDLYRIVGTKMVSALLYAATHRLRNKPIRPPIPARPTATRPQTATVTLCRYPGTCHPTTSGFEQDYRFPPSAGKSHRWPTLGAFLLSILHCSVKQEINNR